MKLALYGKHPLRGDFIEAGVPPAILSGLEVWLDAAMTECRADLGTAWEQAWAQAPLLRFWIGAEIFGHVLCGVLAASQDRVGRRFPFIVMAVAGDGPVPVAPVIETDQTWYTIVEAHVRQVIALPEMAMVPDLLHGLDLPTGAAVGDWADTPDFWAVREGAAITDLIQSVTGTDHSRAVQGRSYWWVEGTEEPASVPSLDHQAPQSPPAALPGEEIVPLADPQHPGGGEGWSEIVDDERSPFATDTGGHGLFAPPQTASPDEIAIAERMFLEMPGPPAPLPWVHGWSRFHAGTGLPSGQVLAWFLRGMVEAG